MSSFHLVVRVIITAVLGDIVIRKGAVTGICGIGSSCNLLGLGLLFTFQPPLDVFGIINLDLYLYKIYGIRNLDGHCIERSAVRLGVSDEILEIIIESSGIFLIECSSKFRRHVFVAYDVTFLIVLYHRL